MATGGKEGKALRVMRTLYAVARYAAAMLVALNLHSLPERVPLLPGVTGPRGFLMLWAALLLGLSVLMDRRWEASRQRDREEGTAHGGDRNRLSFLILALPLLILLDGLAVWHLYAAFFSGEAASGGGAAVWVMAAGCVLWIYGRCLPSLPYRSFWGIRTAESLASEAAWERLHRRGSAVLCVAGALCLAAGTIL